MCSSVDLNHDLFFKIEDSKLYNRIKSHEIYQEPIEIILCPTDQNTLQYPKNIKNKKRKNYGGPIYSFNPTLKIFL